MDSTSRYDSLFQYYSQEAGLTNTSWLRLKAQVKKESSFDPHAKNKVTGALGLAQFMPDTWKEWCDGTPGVQPPDPKTIPFNPFDPEDAIRAQAFYMAWLLKYLQTWDLSFAAYNYGIGNIWKIRKDPNWKNQLPKETSDYVVKINQYYLDYLKS